MPKGVKAVSILTRVQDRSLFSSDSVVWIPNQARTVGISSPIATLPRRRLVCCSKTEATTCAS